MLIVTRHQVMPPTELIEAYAHDCALVYTAEHGWHLIPAHRLESQYGADLDLAAALADALELLDESLAGEAERRQLRRSA